jgi:hypothetical protein
LLSSFAGVAVFVIATVSSSAAQIALHWGPGEAVVSPGAQVRRFSWNDLDANLGGTRFQVDADDAIRPQSIDPRIDLAQLAEQQGGAAIGRGVMFDRDRSTTWRDDGYTCISIRTGCDDIYASPGTNEIDLGGDYLIERVVLISGLDDPALTVRDFRVHLGDVPNFLWCCSPLHPVQAEVRDNRKQIREVSLHAFDRARFLQIAVGEREEGWEIHDIEVYGRGFVEDGLFSANVIDFARPMALGQLHWSGWEGEGARVMIQTRTGADADPTRYWRFTGRGQDKVEIDGEQYAILKVGERAGTTVDHSNWSFWSAPYDFADSAGVHVLSPGPRRYFQFRVNFLPGATGGEVRSLGLQAWPPAATALVGEVWPIQAVAGDWRDFTYVMRATIGPRDSGFDRLELSSGSFLGPVRGVRIADDDVSWTMAEAEPHRLVLSLPALQAKDTGSLIEVDFSAQVLRYGASFDGRVWQGDQVLAAQSVDAGDATGEFEGNRVAVTTSASSQRLLRLVVAPAVITPNADGRNETATLTYEIFEITGQAAVSVEIWDLGGRRVRTVDESQQGIGRYVQTWDGRDDGGRILPTGIYLARVSLGADHLQEHITHLIHLVY